MKKIEGKRVLITGAARGIGRQLALQLAIAHRASVLATDRDSDAVQELVREIRASGGSCQGFRLDVTQSQEVEQLRDELKRQDSLPEILINNAGIVHGGVFSQISLARHLETYEVNLLSCVRVTHAFLPGLLSLPEAQLVFLASATGLVGVPYGSTYASSKWGVIGFAESLRQELKELGNKRLHVTVICPSTVNTGLFEGTKPPVLMPMLDPERLAAKIIQTVKSNRSYLYAPYLVKWVPFLRGTLPLWAQDWVMRALRVTTAMRQWRGRGPR